MQLIPGNAQWIGRRKQQQDAFAFAHIAEDYFRGHGGALAVVADGMGGMAYGAQASYTAVQHFVAAYNEKGSDETVPEALSRALQAANRAVWELARGSAGEGEVGTTLVAAVVLGEQLYWVSAGDSRLYLYRGAENSLAQCTSDHNLLADLMQQVQAGEISRDQARQHPDAEALTSFLGMQRVAKIDRNLRPLPLAPGDRLLLCSDGLFGTLHERELAAALAAAPQAAVDRLLQRVQAEAGDYQDNTTILALGIEESAATAAAPSPSQTTRARGSQRWLLAAGLSIAVLVGVGIWFSARLFGPEPPPVESAVQRPAEALPAAPPAGRIDNSEESASPLATETKPEQMPSADEAPAAAPAEAVDEREQEPVAEGGEADRAATAAQEKTGSVPPEETEAKAESVPPEETEAKAESVPPEETEEKAKSVPPEETEAKPQEAEAKPQEMPTYRQHTPQTLPAHPWYYHPQQRY